MIFGPSLWLSDTGELELRWGRARKEGAILTSEGNKKEGIEYTKQIEVSLTRCYKIRAKRPRRQMEIWRDEIKITS